MLVENIDPLEYVLQGKKNENKGLEEINMRSLSKNVYQGSKKNEYKGQEDINMRSWSKNEYVLQGKKNENKG